MDCFASLAMTAVGGAVSSATHRFDIVAVGVDQERGKIGRAVILAMTRLAIVAAAGLQARGVKLLDRGMVRRAEGDMGAAIGLALVQMQPERGLALGAKTGAGIVAR